MTLSASDRSDTYTGNGSTTTFPYTFKIFSDAEILVRTVTTAGVITVKVLSTDYTVTGAGDDVGGNVVFVTAPASGLSVVLSGNTTVDQDVDYTENDPFPAETHEGALDKLTAIVQEQSESIGRTVQLLPSSSVDTIYMPDPDAGLFLRWNTTEDALENATVADQGAIGVPVVVADGGTGTVTGEITLVAGSDRTTKVNEASSGAGNSFTISAGNAAAASSDVNGGTLLLKPGSAEGTGTGSVELYAGKAGSSGSTTVTPTKIASTHGNGLVIHPHGTSAGNTGELRLLELVANGTNYTGFKSPDSLAGNPIYTLPSADGSANQRLTTNGSGVLSWASVTSAKILQVIQTTKTNTVSVTGTSAVSTGLSTSITPSSSSNKILILAYLNFGLNSAEQNGAWVTLVRDATGLLIGDAAGSRAQVTCFPLPTNVTTTIPATIIYLDSPGTTSSTTYDVQFSSSGAGVTTYLNRSHTDTNSNTFARVASSLIVMEVSA